MYLSGWTRKRPAVSSEAQPQRPNAAKARMKLRKARTPSICQQLSSQFGIAVVVATRFGQDLRFFRVHLFAYFDQPTLTD
jgi:hypothetical protein